MSSVKILNMLAAGALLAVSLPASADHDRWERGHRDWRDRSFEHRHPARRVIIERPVYVDRPVYVERKVVVERPVYVDRPVYVEQAPVYGPPVYNHPGYEPVYTPGVYGAPAPVAYPAPSRPRHHEPNMVGVAAGAAIGAVLGSQVGDRHSRGATTAIGAAIGGMLGSQF